MLSYQCKLWMIEPTVIVQKIVIGMFDRLVSATKN